MTGCTPGPTTFYHHTLPEKAQAILLRGFTGVGVRWDPLGHVALTDRPDSRRGPVVLRIELSPSAAQVVLLHERRRRGTGPRSFAVSPETLVTARISILTAEEAV